MSEREADALVIFGITGDLARKQTFRSLYRLERRGLLDVPVLGVARQNLTDDDLRGRARDAIEQSGEDLDNERDAKQPEQDVNRQDEDVIDFFSPSRCRR